MDEKLINAISFIKSSKHRPKILELISDEMLTPSEISRKTNIRLNHVSMYLSDLKTNDIVVCLNEDTKKGRLYTLSKLGKRAILTLSHGVKE